MSISRKKICHIYYNTAGNSGLYLNPIAKALEGEYEQIFYVNYYYPLSTEGFNRYFFKLTEKNENNHHILIMKNPLIRKAVRFFELKYENYKVLRELRSNQYDVINYSLTNMPDALMLRKIKRILPKAKMVVTCHDVVPFNATNGIDYQTIYDEADTLLVHTRNAFQILKAVYNVPEKKIVYHPFPSIDLSLLNAAGTNRESQEKIPAFLFIGVMRQEKGVQNLVDAWFHLGENFPAKLVIAGFKPDDVEIDFEQISKFKNVNLIVKSLSDDEYFGYVNAADYVVFPYSKVGNSGVLSTVVSLRKIPVTTKLPTFLESGYCIDELMCEPNDVLGLAELINNITHMHSSDYKKYQIKIDGELKKNNGVFEVEVQQAYKYIME